MPRIVKIFIGILIVLFFIILAVFLLGIRLLKHSLPQVQGTITLAGLTYPVKVYRDSFGVPHVFAHNETDLFYAMGYVVAQDRLWQMDLNRRAAMGTLSEIFGADTFEADKFIRILGLPKVAMILTQNLSPQSKEILTAYAAGVNAFIRQYEKQLPNEFIILHYKPQPWKIEHSLAYQRLIAWSLEMAWRVDPIYGELARKISEKKMLELIPGYPENAPTILNSYYTKFSQLQRTIYCIGDHLSNFMGMVSPGLGSNSWVVSGNRTNTGKPLLANDPHLAHQNPSIWHEIHLKAPGIDCYGVSLPGIPGIVIGHNPSIAWGLTNVMADGCDFFVEQINSENQEQYLSHNQWHEIEKTQEEIFIKNQPPCTLVTRHTHHGPIISDIHPILKNDPHVISLKWTGHLMSDEALAFATIMKAKNWSEFIAGLQYFLVPAQNYIYADVNGNIGYYCAGAIPIRLKGNGLFPQPGWGRDFDWQATIPFDRLPHLFNPPEGIIITANNKVVGDNYPFFISTYWEPPYRFLRIKELLSIKNRLSIDDFKKIQLDQYSKHAQFLMPYIIHALPKFDRQTKFETYFCTELEHWDFNSSTQSVAATIFEIFLTKFFDNIFHDEMGDTLFHNFLELPNIPIRVADYLVTRGSSEWFDNIQTPDTTETLTDVILTSLRETFAELEATRGQVLYNWRWGNVHTLTFEHALGKVKPFNRHFNIGPFPSGGSCTSVNNASYSLIQRDFKTIVGPSMRQIMDLSHRNNSLIVITTGQSGYSLSPHFKDQTLLWLNGDYHKAITDSLEICRSGFKLLILEPE